MLILCSFFITITAENCGADIFVETMVIFFFND